MKSRKYANTLDRRSLVRPAPEIARRVLLEQLRSCRRIAPRLRGKSSREALHDLRVGLRRIRSALRAYRPFLADTIGGKSRRRIRDLARSTNEVREADVALAWIGPRVEKAPPSLRRAAGKVHAAVEAWSAACGRRGRRRLASRLPRLVVDLERRLSHYRVRVELGAPAPRQVPFGAATAELIKVQALDLSARLSAQEEAQLHQARICAKRLRYLLEPVAHMTPQGRGLVTRLKDLQDLLGELHDRQVFLSTIERALAAARLPSPDVRRAVAWFSGLAASESKSLLEEVLARRRVDWVRASSGVARNLARPVHRVVSA